MRYELPPANCYVYPRVVIDLGECVIRCKGGQETPLAGMSYDLIALLLAHPGRFIRYPVLAQELLPEFKDRRDRMWDDLDSRQQEAVKHTLHALVCRTRRLLGEQPDSPSLLQNRPRLGYAIQRPLCTTCATQMKWPSQQRLSDPERRHVRAPQNAKSTKGPQERARTSSQQSRRERF